MVKSFRLIGVLAVAGMLNATAWAGNNVSFPTDDPAVAGGDISVTGFLTKLPGVGPFPAVVLLHTCGGLRPHVAAAIGHR